MRDRDRNLACRLSVLGALLALGALSPGCDGPDDSRAQQAANVVWGGKTTVPLLAGKTTVVGSVTAAIEHDQLHVTYVLDPPWTMTESHLDIETDWHLIPQTSHNHNPIPGHFAYHASHDPAVTTYVYDKDISWQPGDTLYIAAHAEVRSAGGASEGAWGAGTRFTPRGSWATYFTFTPTAQEVTERGDDWLLLHVAGRTTDGTDVPFDERIYMVQSATGIADSPLPPEIQADLAADPPPDQQTAFVSQTIVNEIVASERAGALTPLLQAIAEPEDLVPAKAGSEREIGPLSSCSNKTITRSKSLGFGNPTMQFSGEPFPNLQVGLSLSGDMQGSATADVHLAVRRFGLFGKCIPYAVKFKDVHAFGNASINYGATLSGTINYGVAPQGPNAAAVALFERELAKLHLFDVWFMIGYVPVYIGFNLPISIGVDLSASVTGEVTYSSGQTGTASFNYTCTLGGCSGSSSYAPGGSATPSVSASVSGRVEPSIWAEAALRAFLYSDDLLHVQVGVRPYLHGDLWGYLGNSCGDADGDGASETVHGLTFDLDRELTVNLRYKALNHHSDPISLFTTGRHHMLFRDLVGSTAMSPVIEGAATAAAGQPASYRFGMRPCWPYEDRVDLAAAWGDGTTTELGGVPRDGVSAAHTWQQPGTYSLSATALRDDHGRELGRTTTRSVNVTSASGPPAGGLHLWLRADAGVQLATGSQVSGWTDQSGHGRDGVMLTSARQPTLVPGALNGLPVLRFNGQQSMSLAAVAEPTTFTIFVVGRNAKSSGFSMILGPGGNSPNNQLRWEDGTRALFVGTGNDLPTTTSTIGDTHVFHALSARYDGATMAVFRDGNQTSTHTFATTGPWTLASVGSYYSSEFLEGDLAEIMIYDRPLTGAEREAVNAYLRTKYNLP